MKSKYSASHLDEKGVDKKVTARPKTVSQVAYIYKQDVRMMHECKRARVRMCKCVKVPALCAISPGAIGAGGRAHHQHVRYHHAIVKQTTQTQGQAQQRTCWSIAVILLRLFAQSAPMHVRALGHCQGQRCAVISCKFWTGWSVWVSSMHTLSREQPR